jgi:outer membrane protein OmpA-like peptidoglycan-associated protein
MSRLFATGALVVALSAGIDVGINRARVCNLQAQLEETVERAKAASREAERLRSEIAELTTRIQSAERSLKNKMSDLSSQLMAATQITELPKGQLPLTRALMDAKQYDKAAAYAQAAINDFFDEQMMAATQITELPKGQLPLARALMDAKQYDKAAAYAQAAINDILDEQTRQTGVKSAVPSLEELERLKQLSQLAFEGLQLANTFVPPPVSKEHDWGGLYNPRAGSFGVIVVPIPVEYEFDSTAFTPKGREAAATLLVYLRSQPNLKRIKLEGHTDRKGSAEYNYGLSKRRADALAAYLAKDLGSDIEIATIGKGKDEPVVLSDPGRYTQDEIDQINRRVVLVK